MELLGQYRVSNNGCGFLIQQNSLAQLDVFQSINKVGCYYISN